MATQALDPALLKAMREGRPAFEDRFDIVNGQFYDKQTGMVYDPQHGGQPLSGDGQAEGGAGANNYALSDYIQYAQGKNEKDDPYKLFNSADGEFNQDGKFKDVKALQGLATWALIAATMGAGAGALGFTNGMGATGAGAGAGAAGGAGGFIGEGALSGIGAWDGALAGATPGMGTAGAAAGAGAAGAGGGGGGMVSAGLEALPLNTSTLATAGTPLALGGAGAAAGAGGGLLSGLTSGAGGLMDLVVPALGALAGSQGQEQSTTQTRDIPEWLKPYVTGDQGILKQTQGLLNEQMPMAKQARDQFMGVGGGLLNTPQRGNGFDQFSQRRF